MILIGNKADLSHRRVVSYEEATRPTVAVAGMGCQCNWRKGKRNRSSFLVALWSLVVRPGAPSSVLVPSSDVRSS